MKLLRHLIATDLRQFRWILAGWLAVVAFATLINAIPSPGDYDPTGASPIAIARSLLSLAQTILLVAVVPLVMHAHPAVGTNAFWMTRPIPVPALLASKLALLGGVVLAPVAAAALAMAAYQVAPYNILLVSSYAVIAYAGLLLALMVIASWTPDLWRFALVIVAIIAALAGALMLLLMIMLREMSESPMPDPGGFSLNGPAFVPLYFITLTSVLVMQYRTRRLSRSIPLAITALSLVTAVAAVGSSEPKAPPAPQWADGALELVPDLSSLETQADFPFGGRSEWRTVNALVGLRGVPEGWSGSVTLADAAVDLGGTMLTRPWSRRVTGNPGSPNQILPTLLNVSRILYPIEPPMKTVVFAVPRTEFSHYAPAVGRYTGRFWVNFTRHDIEAVMPLQEGAGHRGDWYGFTVDGLEGSPRGVTVLVRQWLAVAGPEMSSYFGFYLRNRTRGEAVATTTEYVRSDVLLRRLVPFGPSAATPNSGFGIYRLRVSFPPRYRIAAVDGPVLDDEWLRAAELVILRSTPAGAVQRTVDIAQFPLREASASAREF